MSVCVIMCVFLTLGRFSTKIQARFFVYFSNLLTNAVLIDFIYSSTGTNLSTVSEFGRKIEIEFCDLAI